VSNPMRRVVTGDQIAQLRNPDPFAVPAWRSPVYRTPLPIVAIVHFVRMLAWLVRFLCRHPVLVLAAVVGVDAAHDPDADGARRRADLHHQQVGGALRLGVHPEDLRPRKR
jgi:hypothetical protein